MGDFLKGHGYLVVKLVIVVILVVCGVVWYFTAETGKNVKNTDEVVSKIDESSEKLIEDVGEVVRLTEESERLHNEFMDIAKDLGILDGEE